MLSLALLFLNDVVASCIAHLFFYHFDLQYLHFFIQLPGFFKLYTRIHVALKYKLIYVVAFDIKK